jgi:hypothetical protein
MTAIDESGRQSFSSRGLPLLHALLLLLQLLPSLDHQQVVAQRISALLFDSRSTLFTGKQFFLFFL